MTIVLSSFRARLARTEKDLAIEALKASKGSIVAAARLCGLDRISFRRIVRRHGLEKMLKPASHANISQRGNSAWRALADA